MWEKSLKKLSFNYVMYLILGWTITMIGLLIYNYFNLNKTTENLAYQEANSYFNRDKVFRVWATGHGGLYVAETKKTPANPYLAHIRDRDITTSTGKKLTLMNPAYALRQINQDFTEAIGISGHITSLKPLRPENFPDPWESEALKKFEKGDTVVSEFIKANNIESLRLMRPLIATNGCLKCHSHQGYQVGDIRGGVSVTIPLTPYLIQKSRTWNAYWISYSAIWAIGILVFIFGYRIIKRYIRKLEDAEKKLIESNDLLEVRVKQRTTELSELNNELIKAKEKAESNELLLNETGKITKVGGWEVNLLTQELIWTKEVYNIHEAAIDYKPNLDQAIDFYSETSKPHIREALNSAIRNGDSFNLDLEIVTSNGNIKSVNSMGRAKRNSKGEITHVIGTFQDISERKEVERQLILAKERASESDRLKSAFLATMSHELRTPLNSIIGFSDLIKEEENIGSIKQFNDLINSSGNHLLNVIEDLFDVSLIDTGQIKVEKEKLEITALICEVHSIIDYEKQYLNKNDIEIVCMNKSQDDEFFINTDNAKLKQILINLLKNALKFTTEGSINFGYNKIKAEGKEFLKFYVSDTGVGIEKEKFDLIFETFRQIDDSYSRPFGGAGIGLSISKKLTELLGGKIWLDSEVGVGSTFYFTIPVNGKVDILKPQPELKADRNALSLKRVLIVEDDENSAKYLKAVLKQLNIIDYCAKDGKEAIKLCKDISDIDLVLMDINMPLMNGYQATKAIKKLRPELPIIAQTAHSISGDYEKAIEAGCNDYVSKPIDKSLLIRKLNEHLKN